MVRIFLSIFFCFSFAVHAHKTSYPYLSEDTWYEFCDWKFSLRENFDLQLVKSGDTVMIEDIADSIWETLKVFEEEYLSKILVPIILITPRTDSALPGKFDHLLLSEKIAAWFVQNIDREPTEKLFPLPIGVPGWRCGYNPMHIDSAQGTISIKDPVPHVRDLFIYVNVSMTHPNRELCLQHFHTLDRVVFDVRKSIYDYFYDLYHSVFVASPRGNGLDCHRTWEALLLGAYPIVEHSSLDPLFEDLPVVLIHDWKEVTEEFLEEKRKIFDQKIWATEKLYAPYWFKKIHALQKKIRKEA